MWSSDAPDGTLACILVPARRRRGPCRREAAVLRALDAVLPALRFFRMGRCVAGLLAAALAVRPLWSAVVLPSDPARHADRLEGFARVRRCRADDPNEHCCRRGSRDLSARAGP